MKDQPRRKFVYEATITVTLEADNKVAAQTAIDSISRSIGPGTEDKPAYWDETRVLYVSDVSKRSRKPTVRRAY